MEKSQVIAIGILLGLLPISLIDCELLHDLGGLVSFELHDAQALVGRYFSYTISPPVINSSVTGIDEFNFLISEVGGSTIPGWLLYNETTSTLYGIPSVGDEGFYLLKVVSMSSTGKLIAEEVFAIEVGLFARRQMTRHDILDGSGRIQPASQQIQQYREVIACKRNEIAAQMSVVFNAKLTNLNASNRVTLLQSLSDFLSLPLDKFNLSPKQSSTMRTFHGLEVFAAGPGNLDIKNNAGMSHGLTVSWSLPCATQSLLNMFPQVISRNIASGHLKRAANLDVIGWYITLVPKEEMGESWTRRKREAVMTIVPTLHPSQTASAMSVTSVTSIAFSSSYFSSTPISTVISSTVDLSRMLPTTSEVSTMFSVFSTFIHDTPSMTSFIFSERGSLTTQMMSTMSSHQLSSITVTSIDTSANLVTMLSESSSQLFSISSRTAEIRTSLELSSFSDLTLLPTPSRSPVSRFQMTSVTLFPTSNNAITNSSFLHHQSTLSSFAAMSSVSSTIPLESSVSLLMSSTETFITSSAVMEHSSFSLPTQLVTRTSPPISISTISDLTQRTELFTTSLSHTQSFLPTSQFLYSTPSLSETLSQRPLTSTYVLMPSSTLVSSLLEVSSSMLPTPGLSLRTSFLTLIPSENLSSSATYTAESSFASQSSSIVTPSFSLRSLSSVIIKSPSTFLSLTSNFVSSSTHSLTSQSSTLFSSLVTSFSELSEVTISETPGILSSLESSRFLSSIFSPVFMTTFSEFSQSSLAPSLYTPSVPRTSAFTSMATQMLSSKTLVSTLVESASSASTLMPNTQSSFEGISSTLVSTEAIASSSDTLSTYMTSTLVETSTLLIESSSYGFEITSGTSEQTSIHTGQLTIIMGSSMTSQILTQSRHESTLHTSYSTTDTSFRTENPSLSLTQPLSSIASVVQSPDDTFHPTSTVPGISTQFMPSSLTSTTVGMMSSPVSSPVSSTLSILSTRSTNVSSFFVHSTPRQTMTSYFPASSSVPLNPSAISSRPSMSGFSSSAFPTSSFFTRSESSILEFSSLIAQSSLKRPGSSSLASFTYSLLDSDISMPVVPSSIPSVSLPFSTSQQLSPSHSIESSVPFFTSSDISGNIITSTSIPLPTSKISQEPTSQSPSTFLFSSSIPSSVPDQHSSRSIFPTSSIPVVSTSQSASFQVSSLSISPSISASTPPVISTSMMPSPSPAITTLSLSSVDTSSYLTTILTRPMSSQSISRQLMSSSTKSSSLDLTPMTSSGVLTTLATSSSHSMMDSTLLSSMSSSVGTSLAPFSTSSTPSLSSLPVGVTSSFVGTRATSFLPTPSLTSQMGMTSSSVFVTQEPTTEPPLPTSEPVNQPPKLQHPIDEIVLSRGDVLEFPIPEDTFLDEEDGLTPNLRLNLFTKEVGNVSESYWLQLDQHEQVLFGVPLAVNLTNQRNEFWLSATDTEGLVAYDAFVVVVNERSSEFNHEYILMIENNFEDFVADGRNLVSFCQSMASYLGDQDTTAFSVNSLQQGSVIVSYSNKTIPRDVCDYGLINQVLSWLISSVNITLSSQIGTHIAEFQVTNVQRMFLNLCVTTTVPSPTAVPQLPLKPNYLVTIIVPAVTVSVVTLIIFLVICCFYKRKRGGEEFLLRGEKLIYAKNRKPIYLDGELDDGRLEGISNPVVLPEDIQLLKSAPLTRRTVRMPPKEEAQIHPQPPPPPPQYRLPDYAKIGVELDDFHDREPPAYTSNPILYAGATPAGSNLIPDNDTDGIRPPLYRLPPPYQSQENGYFRDSYL